jgi:hypothetical protein
MIHLRQNVNGIAEFFASCLEHKKHIPHATMRNMQFSGTQVQVEHDCIAAIRIPEALIFEKRIIVTFMHQICAAGERTVDDDGISFVKRDFLMNIRHRNLLGYVVRVGCLFR